MRHFVNYERLNVTLNIGFTGTQMGMTALQKQKLREEFQRQQKIFKEDIWFVHGDCVGADAEADAIAAELGIRRTSFPGYDEEGSFPKRAYCNVDVVQEAAPYLKRNKSIVQCSNMLIAAAKLQVVEQRSGTWSTVRYAEKKKIPTMILWPDGTVTK